MVYYNCSSLLLGVTNCEILHVIIIAPLGVFVLVLKMHEAPRCATLNYLANVKLGCLWCATVSLNSKYLLGYGKGL